MHFSTLTLLSLAAVGLVASQNAIATGQSVFVSTNGNVEFGLNIPNNSTDITFSLRGSLKNAWTAVGLGRKDMKGALVLMIYQNGAGTNVTLSPRLSTKWTEPAFSPDVRVVALPGTGVDEAKGTLRFNGRCANCRSWPDGALDASSTAAPFIFAVGPDNSPLRSDDLSVSVPYHAEVGWFSMDMVRATGAARVPDLAVLGGGSPGTDYAHMQDLAALIHGIVALVCFLGLLPLCAVMFHSGWRPRLYIALFSFAAFITLCGIAVGIYDATWYTKTKSFNTTHEIIGFVVFGFVALETVLSWLYLPSHRRNTEPDTRGLQILYSVLVVLTWLTILLGCVNGFLGYPLAFHTDKDKIIGGVFAGMAIVAIVLLTVVLRKKRASRAPHPDKQPNQLS